MSSKESGLLQSFINYFKITRLKEIFLMTGFSMIGVFFTPDFEFDLLLIFALFFQVVLFVIAVYCLNSYADYEEDKESLRLKDVSQISKHTYFILMVFFVVLFLSVGVLLNINIALFSFTAFLFWCTYYLPPLRLKSTFLLGTLIHFVCGIIHFHVGYSLFNTISLHSLIYSIYFALLLSLGHFNHELIDYEDDLKNSTITTAVRIGQSNTLKIRRLLLIVAILYLSLAFYTKYIDEWIFFSFFIASISSLIIDIMSTYMSPKIFQKITRNLFLLAGTITIFSRMV
ncbi:MAG: UbiA family prenyltransferase [Chitinophagales bacterium]